MLKIVAVLGALSFPLSMAAAADAQMNFQDKKEHVLNANPYIELSGFTTNNVYSRSDFRLTTNLRWKNIGQKPISAFELTVLYFDPFNKQLSAGGRWLVTGKSSGNWGALNPGEGASDGLIGFTTQPVMTAFAFVRRVRLTDGSVWEADEARMRAELKSRLPTLKEVNFDVRPSREKD